MNAFQEHSQPGTVSQGSGLAVVVRQQVMESLTSFLDQEHMGGLFAAPAATCRTGGALDGAFRSVGSMSDVPESLGMREQNLQWNQIVRIFVIIVL